jgi:hypothetical protein
MFPFFFDYATPSAFQSDRRHAELGLTADARRPVRFCARVKEQAFPLRLALQALGDLVWSDDTWVPAGDLRGALLDPVVTVHPDRMLLEAFSHDQSAYGLVSLDRGLFEPEGEVRCGTTNIDFTAWLWTALGEMRSSRQTRLRIDAAGLEVQTRGAGGRFERRADMPEEWLRGLLQLQAAMTLPGTRVLARPVDLLAAIRFLRYTKAKFSPRALRYEFEPGREVRIVLEPWEQAFPLKGSQHHYEERRVIRTWGRRRLRVLEPLLPYADAVEVYLKGRALPSFYAVTLSGITFLLGLSGWTENRWTEGGGPDLPGDGACADDLGERALGVLRDRLVIRADDLAVALGVGREGAARALSRLCRRGQVLYDLRRREYRHRELFVGPVDETRLFPLDPRRERARELVESGAVRVTSCGIKETRKARTLPTPDGPVRREVVYRDWQVAGASGDQPAVEAVIQDSGRIIFGTCGCRFFRENYLNRGPCEHLIALRLASESQRPDLPTSAPAAEPPRPRPTRPADLDPEEDDAEDGEGEE